MEEDRVPCEDFATCGVAQFQNKNFWKNVKQQDSYFVVEDIGATFGVNLGGTERIALYGVADGHGEFGEICANFIRRNLPPQLANSPHFAAGRLNDAFHEAFAQTEVLQQSAGLPLYASGACAIAAAVSATHIVVANCGDCRAVLAEQGKAQDLSNDHNVENALPEEIQRVLDAGGQITPDQRVTLPGAPGRLATTRSLGDYWAKPKGPGDKHVVCAIPEIRTIARTPGQHYLVLASDGIFGFMSSQEVISLCISASGELSPSSPLSRLAHTCLCTAVNSKRSDDNCTCLVVDLRRVEAHGGSPPSCLPSHRPGHGPGGMAPAFQGHGAPQGFSAGRHAGPPYDPAPYEGRPPPGPGPAPAPARPEPAPPAASRFGAAEPGPQLGAPMQHVRTAPAAMDRYAQEEAPYPEQPGRAGGAPGAPPRGDRFDGPPPYEDSPGRDSDLDNSLSSLVAPDEVCWCPWCWCRSREGEAENVVLGSFEKWRLHMHEQHFDKLGGAYGPEEIVPCYWCCRPCVTKHGQHKAANRLPFWGSHERVCKENPNKPAAMPARGSSDNALDRIPNGGALERKPDLDRTRGSVATSQARRDEGGGGGYPRQGKSYGSDYDSRRRPGEPPEAPPRQPAAKATTGGRQRAL